MSKELREKICRFCFKYVHNNRPCGCLATQDDIKNCEILLKNVKQWARNCVPEERELLKTNSLSDDIIYQSNHEAEIYNQCREDTLKRIEEE